MALTTYRIYYRDKQFGELSFPLIAPNWELAIQYAVKVNPWIEGRILRTFPAN